MNDALAYDRQLMHSSMMTGEATRGEGGECNSNESANTKSSGVFNLQHHQILTIPFIISLPQPHTTIPYNTILSYTVKCTTASDLSPNATVTGQHNVLMALVSHTLSLDPIAVMPAHLPRLS